MSASDFSRLLLAGTALLLVSANSLAAHVIIPAGASGTVPAGSHSLACADLSVQGTMSVGASQLGGVGNLSIAPAAMLNAGAGTITVGGGWANAGTFMRGTSSVVFADGCTTSPAQLSGITAFTNLAFTSGTGRTFIVPAGNSISVAGNLTFMGTSANPIQVTSDTPGQATHIALGAGATYTSANAQVASAVAISPDSIVPSVASLDFGGQSMNTTAPALAVTLTNIGGSPATISGVTVSTYFAVTHNCATLVPSASCTATVKFTPTAQGSLNGTLTVSSDAWAQSVSLAGTGEKSLVTQYYRAILNRAPDSAGKSYWESEAARLQGLLVDINETWYVMAGYFFNSAEYVSYNKNDTQFVTDLYNTFFNRAPDSGGLGYWVGQIAGGLPREVVLFSFMFSPEFKSFTQGIFGNTASRAEVNVVIDFFRGILNKLPDTDSFNYWLGRMRTAQCAGAGPVYTEVDNSSYFFLFSPEYAARNRNNTQLVTDMYYSFLRRGGDTAGVQYWVNQLNTGQMNVNTVRSNFLNSPEFGTRVQAVIAQGCFP